MARYFDQTNENQIVGSSIGWHLRWKEILARRVYDERGQWIGQATSGVWSPTLKQNLALAQVEAPFAKVGTRLKIEVTAEYRRHQVTATVVETPFFNPPRKRS